MKLRILVVLSAVGLLGGIGKLLADEMTYVWLSCNGTVVSRTSVGKLEVLTTDKNLPGCLGPKWENSDQKDSTTTSYFSNASGTIDAEVHNSDTILSDDSENEDESRELRNLNMGEPLLDLAQKDIVAYRTELMKQQQIRYTNALRSLRMRHAASMQSKTDAYLIQDDAVVVTGSGKNWTAVQGATVSVTDTRENTITADTTGKADGYVATRFLRDPNPSDLVRIGQADQQFWSDVARVKVAHSVNVRTHPWYGAKILFVLTDATPVYVVSTVDNWSEIISDDRTIHGYIRSEYISVEKSQRVEVAPLLK